MAATAPMSERATQWGRAWGARAAGLGGERAAAAPHLRGGDQARGNLGEGKRVLEVGVRHGVFLRAAARRGRRGVRARTRPRRCSSWPARACPRATYGSATSSRCRTRTTCSTSSPASTRSSSRLTSSARCARRAGSRSPAAPVVIQVWGLHERCDLEAMKAVARPFMPPRPPDAPPEPDLPRAGVARAPGGRGRARAAELLRPQLGVRVRRRGGAWTGACSLRRASATSSGRPARTRYAGRSSKRSRRAGRREGGYRLENEFHVLIASA